MKKETKKRVSKKVKIGDKITINRRTLEVRSSNPPLDPGTGNEKVRLYQVDSPDDINVVDTFKSADKLTDYDKLEFENGRLRSMLVTWSDYLQLDGKLYKLQIDPLARKIQVITQ